MIPAVEVLTASQVERVYALTDEIGLHRDWVVVPLNAAEEGRELLMPDGKLLVRPPGGDRFDGWFAGLRERLLGLELSRVPRRHEDDPKRGLTSAGEPKLAGTRRYLPGR